MKERIFTSLFLIAVILWQGISSKPYTKEYLSYPSLPQPIAEETVLITSAGQSTDTYVIKDMANELLIHNYFMPKANSNDMSKVNSVIIVFGYSKTGSFQYENFLEEESKRLFELIATAKEKQLPLIGVFIGGKQRRNDETDALLHAFLQDMDYIIGTESGNHDGLLFDLASEKDIPITLVKDIYSISEPLTSIFR